MKKIILMLSALILSQGAFAASKYAFECTCTSSAKACLGVENLNVIVNGLEVEGSMGSEDWEFNDSFTANISKQGSPIGTTRYDLEENTYGPMTYNNASIIVPSAKAKKGSVQLINRKTGKLKLAFSCVGANPDSL